MLWVPSAERSRQVHLMAFAHAEGVEDRDFCVTMHRLGAYRLYVCMYVWSSHIAEYGSTG